MFSIIKHKLLIKDYNYCKKIKLYSIFKQVLNLRNLIINFIKQRNLIQQKSISINTSIKMSRCINSSLISLVAISGVDSTNNTSNSNNGHVLPTNKIIVNGKTNNMTNNNQDKSKCTEQARNIIKNSDIVCFDVDSTVIKEEGIDELAKFCGKGAEVSRLTKEAMGGSMTFQDALKLRLDIIRPNQKQVKEFLKLHPSTLSTGVKDFINKLRKNGTQVYLISGGFDCLIEPVATELDIPMTNVFANKLMFYFNGEYAGFDINQPTSHSGGKGEAISIIRKLTSTTCTDANITMIGDGATDLEAVPPANNFIGYGGNVIRNEVQARSQYYITNFNQILNLE